MAESMGFCMHLSLKSIDSDILLPPPLHCLLMTSPHTNTGIITYLCRKKKERKYVHLDPRVHWWDLSFPCFNSHHMQRILTKTAKVKKKKKWPRVLTYPGKALERLIVLRLKESSIILHLGNQVGSQKQCWPWKERPVVFLVRLEAGRARRLPSSDPWLPDMELLPHQSLVGSCGKLSSRY